MNEPRVRTRLTPAARREQLLATAKKMIVDDGLQSFTMEALARSAGVSSPLVYNYFDSRGALLQELLKEEYEAYTDKLAGEIGAAETFEEVVRIFITSNFDHHAPGNILPILQSQPEIAGAIEASQAEQSRRTARFLVQNTAQNYRLGKRQAELAVRMSSGASIAAAAYGGRTGAERKKIIETVLAYVLAGIEQIAARDG
jgi:AcrR family transcriptional regulator